VLRTSIVLAVGAVALVLAACGGEDEPPPKPDLPADQMLDRAFQRLPESGVASIDFEARRFEDPSESVAAQLDGPFVRGGGIPSFELEGEAEAAGFGVDLSLVSTGDDAYVVFFGENYRVGRERVSALARQGDLDPRAWFGPAEHAGTEEIDGVDAYAIEAPLTDQVSTDLQRLGAGSIGLGAPIEGTAQVLVGVDDGVIRRLELASDALDLDLTLSDLGEPQTIEPPPGGGFQPIEDLLARIPGL